MHIQIHIGSQSEPEPEKKGNDMNKTKINLLFACLLFSFTSLFGQLSEAEVKAMILESNEQQLVVNSSRMLQENHYYFVYLKTMQQRLHKF